MFAQVEPRMSGILFTGHSMHNMLIIADIFDIFDIFGIYVKCNR